MASRLSPPQPQLTDAIWRELDDVIGAIARLARSEEAPAQFYRSLLERVISALAATGGAIWTRDADGNLQQECLVNPPPPWSCQNLAQVVEHRELMERVLASGEPQLLPPRRMPTPGDPSANPTENLLVLFPWQIEQAPAGLIELFQRPGGGPKAEQGYLDFLEVVAEFVVEFHRNRQLIEYRQVARDWSRVDRFARQVHADLDLRRTAYAIVNEGRLLLECDRISLCLRRGRGYRLTAVSGVDAPNRRAELARRMERLCLAAAKVGEPLWFPAESDGIGDSPPSCKAPSGPFRQIGTVPSSAELPPPLEEPLDEYLDESHARALVVLPLMRETSARGSASAVLVVENFLGTFRESTRALLVQASAHMEAGLRNCLELQSIPFASVLRARRKPAGYPWWLKCALAAGLAAGIVAAALLLKADFTVVADGDLEPVRLRDVFARADGTLHDLRVEHGQHVRAGELLAVLRRPQLDLEFKQVLGQLQTAQQKLVAIETERLQVPRDSDEQRRRYGQATAQEEELRETVRSLQAQYEVLKAEQSECEVRSPVEGDVLTWNVRQLLEDRPVSRGQVLLAVGDLSGPWKVDLRIPDRHAGHVRAAQEAQPGAPLEVSCLLAMNPRRSFPGKLARLAMRSETSKAESPYVAASVDFDRSALQQCTAGAGVRAYIRCGRRGLGYVWLHDLYDTIRMWLFF